jgi:cold shock CspA family protein
MNNSADGRLEGVVTYWNSPKGFGFARKQDGSEAFVHINEVEDETIEDLEVGQHIAFDEQPAKRGGGKPEAIDVRLLTEAKDGEPKPPATPATATTTMAEEPPTTTAMVGEKSPA